MEIKTKKSFNDLLGSLVEEILDEEELDEVNTIDLYEYNKLYRFPLGLTVKHDLAILCHKI